jgi:aspartyl protease family protein
MIPDFGANTLLYLLLIILPVSALIGRRVPLVRVFGMLLGWGVLFAIALVVLNERERFDPYLARIASALKLDDQTVAGNEVRIRMSPDGHFWARVKLDGVSRRMLVDSGATVTAVSSVTAKAAGLGVHKSMFPMIVQTANGSVPADVSAVQTLTLGDITARDLPVVVSPAFGDTDVLGMNFLSRLKSWRVEDRTLILTPHHPQDFT